MNARAIELALKKQRLQLRSAALRGEIAAAAAGMKPLFATVDRIGDGLRWLREHHQWAVAGLVALLAARPRAALRWGRRGWFVWQALRRLRGSVQDIV
ncbi:YqjK family protein [Denitratisoma oestradiolicum]|uniref:YqjK-like protein n=1 Tax=Denitratisoma oestradiolicum TaxID=311182 RepID=A0A6S6XUQ2_9PROT|nr:YqjK family protein [Denitratisoma oestradiolicum]TWO81073.1 hypothetical protein CBW56_05545 [Denitratisoma oestradiolicum]CAB1367747.1 conserved protein of unknown function [Denitratisoma oestradiolicum]